MKRAVFVLWGVLMAICISAIACRQADDSTGEPPPPSAFNCLMFKNAADCTISLLDWDRLYGAFAMDGVSYACNSVNNADCGRSEWQPDLPEKGPADTTFYFTFEDTDSGVTGQSNWVMPENYDGAPVELTVNCSAPDNTDGQIPDCFSATGTCEDEELPDFAAAFAPYIPAGATNLIFVNGPEICSMLGREYDRADGGKTYDVPCEQFAEYGLIPDPDGNSLGVWPWVSYNLKSSTPIVVCQAYIITGTATAREGADFRTKSNGTFDIITYTNNNHYVLTTSCLEVNEPLLSGRSGWTPVNKVPVDEKETAGWGGFPNWVIWPNQGGGQDSEVYLYAFAIYGYPE